MNSKNDTGPEGIAKRGAEPDGIAKRGDDDVEGHSMMINPTVSRDLSKARTADVERAVRSRQHEAEAKRPFRK